MQSYAQLVQNAPIIAILISILVSLCTMGACVCLHMIVCMYLHVRVVGCVCVNVCVCICACVCVCGGGGLTVWMPSAYYYACMHTNRYTIHA